MSECAPHMLEDGQPPAAAERVAHAGLSVVVAVYDPGPELARCLDALQSSLAENVELIVVDDGSARDVEAVCRMRGLRVIRLDRNIGRGPARNIGWRAAGNEWIAFIDHDVEVGADTLIRICRIAEENPDWAAFFGSYDDEPGDPGLVSQYRNLLHHFAHQRSAAQARHFWPGLGALKRSVLLEVGGFGEDQWARNMEEVDLGARLVAAGYRIHVVKDLQAKHLKRYTLLSMLKSDLIDRAWPWSSHMMDGRSGRNRHVLSPAHQLSAIGAVLLIAAVPAAALAGAGVGGAAAVAGAMLFAGANRRFFGFLWEKRGAVFAVAAVPLHLLHTLCAVTGFALAAAGFRPRMSDPSRGAAASSR